MRIKVFSVIIQPHSQKMFYMQILLILYLSNVCMSKLDEEGNNSGKIDESSIKYELISDEILAPNSFKIS